MADLTVLIPRRAEPRWEKRPSPPSGSTDTVEREVATEDVASIMLRFATARAARLCSRRSVPAVENRCSGDRMVDRRAGLGFGDAGHLWLGHRERATRSCLHQLMPI